MYLLFRGLPHSRVHVLLLGCPLFKVQDTLLPTPAGPGLLRVQFPGIMIFLSPWTAVVEDELATVVALPCYEYCFGMLLRIILLNTITSRLCIFMAITIVRRCGKGALRNMV